MEWDIFRRGFSVPSDSWIVRIPILPREIGQWLYPSPFRPLDDFRGKDGNRHWSSYSSYCHFSWIINEECVNILIKVDNRNRCTFFGICTNFYVNRPSRSWYCHFWWIINEERVNTLLYAHICNVLNVISIKMGRSGWLYVGVVIFWVGVGRSGSEWVGACFSTGHTLFGITLCVIYLYMNSKHIDKSECNLIAPFICKNFIFVVK